MATTEQQNEVHRIEHPHPREGTYVKIALVLGIVTGIEIAMSYIDMNEWLLIVGLIFLSVIKFTLVVQWFMHLKFDNPTLRKPFIGGLAIALTVYAVVLVNLVYHGSS